MTCWLTRLIKKEMSNQSDNILCFDIDLDNQKSLEVFNERKI